MKIVIVGAGEVGINIASQLISERKDVVIIEKDPERVQKANDLLDCLVILGEGTNVAVLESAGIENADIFIAATSIDEVNMVSCFVASSEYNIPVKIARVRNVGYAKSDIFNRSSIGIDYIVNPEVEASYEIAETVDLGAVSGVFAFTGTRAQLRDFYIDKDSFFANKTLKDIRLEIRENFIIAGVYRDEEVLIPSGDFVILESDHIYMVSLSNTFNKILTKTGKKLAKIRKVIIVGGGVIGKHVVGLLLEQGREILLIEKDHDKCKELAALFEDVMVINGDISDDVTFNEENLGSADVIVTTTLNEELNILAAIYAKKNGVKHSIALINRQNYVNLATSLGVDSCVTPKLSSVDAILRFIRKGNVKNVYTVFEGKAEAIEFTVSKNSELDGKTLIDIKFPNNCLIVAIQRGHSTIIPSGNYVIRAEDSLIAFVTTNSLEEFEDFLSN